MAGGGLNRRRRGAKEGGGVQKPERVLNKGV
jgi:hypothetical protein